MRIKFTGEGGWFASQNREPLAKVADPVVQNDNVNIKERPVYIDRDGTPVYAPTRAVSS